MGLVVMENDQLSYSMFSGCKILNRWLQFSNAFSRLGGDNLYNHDKDDRNQYAYGSP